MRNHPHLRKHHDGNQYLSGCGQPRAAFCKELKASLSSFFASHAAAVVVDAVDAVAAGLEHGFRQVFEN